MEFKGFFINMLLVVAIIFASVGFIVTMQGPGNYNVANPLINDSSATFLTNISQSATNLSSNASSGQSAFYSSNPSVDSGGLIITTIVSAGQIFSGTISTMYNILIGGLASNLGIDPVLVGIFTAMMIGGIVLMAWSLYRLGR